MKVSEWEAGEGIPAAVTDEAQRVATEAIAASNYAVDGIAKIPLTRLGLAVLLLEHDAERDEIKAFVAQIRASCTIELHEKHGLDWAIAKMRGGARVRRRSWSNGNDLYLRDGEIYDPCSDDGNGCWTPALADLTATDWQIVGSDE